MAFQIYSLFFFFHLKHNKLILLLMKHIYFTRMTPIQRATSALLGLISRSELLKWRGRLLNCRLWV